MKHKLIYDRRAGGYSAICSLYNQLGVAEFVITMDHNEGFTHSVLRVPDEKVIVTWRKLGKDMHNCPVEPNKFIVTKSLA